MAMAPKHNLLSVAVDVYAKSPSTLDRVTVGQMRRAAEAGRGFTWLDWAERYGVLVAAGAGGHCGISSAVWNRRVSLLIAVYRVGMGAGGNSFAVEPFCVTVRQ